MKVLIIGVSPAVLLQRHDFDGWTKQQRLSFWNAVVLFPMQIVDCLLYRRCY
jgi:hypothetical protein